MNAFPRDAAAHDLTAQERSGLAEKYLPMARKVAARFAAFRRMDAESAEEYQSVAFFALARAAVNFRTGRGVTFARYARETIRKSLIREAATSGYGGRRTRLPTAPRFEPLPGNDSAAACMVDRRTPAPDARLLADEDVRGWWDKLTPTEQDAVRIIEFEGRAREDAARELRRPVRVVGKAKRDAVRALRMVG